MRNMILIVTCLLLLVESNGCVLAHNLFSDCEFHFMASPKRIVPFYKPHSSVRAGKTAVSLQHNSVFNRKIPLADMFPEHPDGRPLNITADYFGFEIDPAKVVPGPFQNIRPGKNRLRLWPR